ncbi:uL11 family ribosomal protein [Candidatus Vidania fulgoroideorum]
MLDKITVKLKLKLNSAKPDSTLGSALGSKGVNVHSFCLVFNKINKGKAGTLVPVRVFINSDKTYKIKIMKPTLTSLFKKHIGFSKGSPNGIMYTIKESLIEIIAKEKIKDFNTRDLSKAKKIVIASAKSIGISVL